MRIAFKILCLGQTYFLEKIKNKGKLICSKVDENESASLQTAEMKYEEIRDKTLEIINCAKNVRDSEQVTLEKSPYIRLLKMLFHSYLSFHS